MSRLWRGVCIWSGLGLAAVVGCGEEVHRDPALERLREETEPLRQALEAQPGAPGLHFQLGQVFLQHGVKDSALVAFERSVVLLPEFADAHFQLAQIYYDEGRVQEALAAYRKTVSLRPDHSHALNNLGFIYKKLGEMESAEEFYRRAIEQDPKFFQAYNNLGQIF